ncbi:MAG: type 1 glutamine amidotransferase [Bacteroidales bacterium]|nr:type 1 glutamine amidotransferase [Bacteroidales bacterium]MCF8391047.1 type 1 glutamine amidotransferase [Bacteroidales bacterium]
MRVSILKHVHFENPGYYLDYFDRKGFKVLIHNLYEGDMPDLNADLILVLGGPMNIYEESEYPFLESEKKYLKNAIREGKKIIGVCLGSQLIADVLGSETYKNAHKEIGWFPIQKSTSNKFNFLPDIFTAFHWHGDTFDLPDGAEVLFNSKATKNQAFLFGCDVLAMQFHLEMDEKIIRDLLHYCRADIDNSLFVMSEKDIISQCYEHSSLNKEILWNLLDHFLK